MPIDNLSKITSRSGINTTILLEAGNANVTGIVTAAGFDGPFTGGGGNNVGIITAAGGLHVGAAGTVLHAINDSGVANLSAINFAFHESLIVVVQTAVHTALTSSAISVVPSGSFVNGLSTRLSDASKVPALRTNLSKDLVSSFPSFLMTVAFLTCTCLYCVTISILSYSIDSVSAIREVLRTKLI